MLTHLTDLDINPELAMSNSDPKTRNRRTSVSVANGIVTFLAFAVIASLIFYLIVNAFAYGIGLGLRSVAAVLLPMMGIAYIALFAKAFKSPYRTQLPRINLYVLSTLWMIGLLVIFENTYGSDNTLPIPIVELLLSLTLLVMVTLYRSKQYLTALATSYGILSGILIYVIFRTYVDI
ncbi:MAG: hypothetical protein ACFE0I_25535 [Elainellaceae cyanobacterium]